MKTPEKPELKKAFLDIVRGYSEHTYQKKPVLVKHLSLIDDLELDSIYDKYFHIAKKRGALTEQESLDFLDREGIWTKDDELALQQQTAFLEQLERTRTKNVIKQQREQIDKEIEDARAKLAAKRMEKGSFIEKTCESYAENKKNDYSIYVSLYSDDSLTKRLFSLESFENLQYHDVEELTSLYIGSLKLFSVENLKHISIQPFFYNFFMLVPEDHPSLFFEKKPYELTYYQVKLLDFARTFRNIFSNIKIPDEIKADPDKILEYAQSDEKRQQMSDRIKERQGSSIVGASTKEMEKISGQKGVTPFDMLKKSGKKSLNARDFSKFGS